VSAVRYDPASGRPTTSRRSQEGVVIRLYTIPLSTNVERVSLALAHKGLAAETITVDPKDRSEVLRVSGQELVPVIDDDGKVVHDSTAIIRYLETRSPGKPLFPREAARRAEVELFLDWFDRVWKRPPNEIYLEMRKEAPDRSRIERLGRAMTDALDRFEALLDGRDHLMGDFSAADCIAFPFLKFSLLGNENDPYLFHEILVRHQPLGEDHPRLASWIRRVDGRPRA
jgi:glutathione S-transferase